MKTFVAVLILAASMSGAAAQSILHDFSYVDGSGPNTALYRAANGTLYGGSAFGGNGNAGAFGTIWKLTPAGRFSILHNFTGTDGWSIQAMNLAPDGYLYGVTSLGGASYGSDPRGFGSIFRILPSGSGFQSLYSFTGGTDGQNPNHGMAIDSTGNIYGTCLSSPGTSGVAWQFAPATGTLTVLTTFALGVQQAAFPLTIDLSGNLYGVSYGLLVNSQVYKLVNNGGAWSKTIVGSLPGNFPSGPAAVDRFGNVFGVTFQGDEPAGTVYEFIKQPNGGYTYRELLALPADYSLGYQPSSVVPRSEGTYVTTNGDNTNTFGTVLKIKQNGHGYQATVLATFDGSNGSRPSGAPAFDSAGNLYGTTFYGGPSDCGGSTCGVGWEIPAQ